MEHRSYLRQLRPHAKRNPHCRQHYNLQLACYRQLRGGEDDTANNDNNNDNNNTIHILPCLAEIKQGWEAEQMPGYRSIENTTWPIYQDASQPECRYSTKDNPKPCRKKDAITYVSPGPNKTAGKLRGIYSKIVLALIAVGAVVGAATPVGALTGVAVGGSAGVASVSALVHWGDPRFGLQEPDCKRGNTILNLLFTKLNKDDLGIVVSHHKYMAKKLIPLPQSGRKEIKRTMRQITFSTKFQHMFDETICKEGKEGKEGKPEHQISEAYKTIRQRELKDTAEIQHILQEMDKDGDRHISEAELVDWFSKKSGFANGCCIEVQQKQLEDQRNFYVCTCIYSNEKFRDRIEKYSYVREGDTWSLDTDHNATWGDQYAKIGDTRKKLWIIRHGNSLHNGPVKLKGSAKGLFHRPHVIDSCLTPIGMQQARVCGQALAQKKADQEGYAAKKMKYFASPLFRAQHTCAIIKQAMEEGAAKAEEAEKTSGAAEAGGREDNNDEYMTCKKEPKKEEVQQASSFVDWCNKEACKRFWESGAAEAMKWEKSQG